MITIKAIGWAGLVSIAFAIITSHLTHQHENHSYSNQDIDRGGKNNREKYVSWDQTYFYVFKKISNIFLSKKEAKAETNMT